MELFLEDVSPGSGRIVAVDLWRCYFRDVAERIDRLVPSAGCLFGTVNVYLTKIVNNGIIRTRTCNEENQTVERRQKQSNRHGI
jgi:hypothetical protein